MTSHPLTHRLAALALVLAIGQLLPCAALADDIDATWLGGSSNWNDAGNWSSAAVPNNNGHAYDVFIDGGSTGVASVVSFDMNATISDLTIDAGDRLQINNNTTLVIDTGSTIQNAGTMTLNAASYYNSTLHISGGDVTLNGGGTVTMGNHSNNRIRGSTATDRLVNEDNTIQGAGKIGQNAIAFTNRGLIDANQSNSLTLDPSASGAINSGTMRASTGATLVLYSGAFQNDEGAANGLLRADGGTVVVQSSTVTGGATDVVGSGVVELSNGTIRGGTLTNSSSGTIRTTGGTSTISLGTSASRLLRFYLHLITSNQ